MTEIEQLYRQKVVDIYNRIALTGLPERDPRLNDIPLDKIFIKLTMAIEAAFQPSIPFELLESKASALEISSKSKDSDLDERLLRRQWEREQKERPPEPIALATALQKHSRLFISGVPGSGKTTLLRWLAVIFANQQQADAERLGPAFTEDVIPIVLELRRFSKRFQRLGENQAAPFDLAHEISAFVGADPRFHGIYEEWMHETLAKKPCLLLIDGLDEIADQHTRQNVLESLEAFVQIPNYAHVRCILTTRPHGFRDVHLSAQFQRTEIQPFTSEEVAQFIHHWYETAYAFEYQAEAEELIAAIQAKPRVTEIAQNPLLCTIIAIIYRNNRVLPNRRVDLYLKCCEALLDTWERNKQIKESGLIGGFDWQVKLELLMPVAYWFHQQTEQLAMPEEAVVNELAKALEKLRKKSGLQSADKPIEQEARDFIAAIRDRSGLLQGRGDGTLEFTHRTFQEYLAARYIASQPEPEYIDLVMNHLHEAWWREVHLLVIGHLGSSSDTAKKAERLMLTILNVYKEPSSWLLPPTGKWTYWLNNWLSLTYKTKRRTIAKFLLSLSLKVNLGTQFPRWQWQKRIAWHLMRELELVAQGYADCAATARTETLTNILSQFAEQRVLKWFNNHFYEEQLFFLLEILKQQTLPCDAAISTIFIKALQDHKDWVLSIAAESLVLLGDKSDKVIEALILHLQDKDDGVRWLAVRSLGKLGNNNDKVIEALILHLQDEDDDVRRAAARSLGELKIKDKAQLQSVLIALNRRLHDSDNRVRRYAFDSLRKLLEGRPIPGYRWKPLAKQTFWQRLREPTVEKIILILLVGVLLVPLSLVVPAFVQLLVIVSIAFTILWPLLFPPKN
jgi:predicted NACHT family NTPase